MTTTEKKTKCRVCDVLITQAEADEAAEIVGMGHETMCRDCAKAISETPCEEKEPQ